MSINRVVCLNCMDGRVQLPVIAWIQEQYQVDYVDMVTEPGMDGLLSDSDRSADSVDNKIQISIDKNNAQKIFVVGHHDCQGNPVSDEVHREQIAASVARVQKTFQSLEVIGLWVTAEWQVEKV